MKLPTINITETNFNHNHKYRFGLLLPPRIYKLMTVSFKKEDNSIYLAPNIDIAITIIGNDFNNTEFKLTANPDSGLHISFHDNSGVVNISSRSGDGQNESYRLREKQSTFIWPPFNNRNK